MIRGDPGSSFEIKRRSLAGMTGSRGWPGSHFVETGRDDISWRLADMTRPLRSLTTNYLMVNLALRPTAAGSKKNEVAIFNSGFQSTEKLIGREGIL
jgi:hypothetical protein